MNLLCAVNVSTQPLKSLPDIQSSDHAVSILKELANKGSGQVKWHAHFTLAKFIDNIILNCEEKF